MHRLCVSALGFALAACNRGAQQAPPQAAPAAVVEPAPQGTPLDVPSADEVQAARTADLPRAAEPSDAGSDAAATGEPATDAPKVAPQAKTKAQLLADVKSVKVSDDDAHAALVQAEAWNARKRELARAAYERGRNLHNQPERAAAFYQWAQDKDTSYPEPVFERARLAAMTGEIPELKKLLTEVKARGGHNLLSQVEFDPTWAIVADDPDVRALLRDSPRD